MGFENVRLDVPTDLEQDLRDALAAGDIPEWLTTTGIDKDKSPEQALAEAREIGGPVVARLQILENAPDPIHTVVDEFTPPADIENRPGMFFRGFEVIARFSDGDMAEMKVAGVYQD